MKEMIVGRYYFILSENNTQHTIPEGLLVHRLIKKPHMKTIQKTLAQGHAAPGRPRLLKQDGGALTVRRLKLFNL